MDDRKKQFFRPEVTPQGVLVIIVEPDGHVAAVGYDFSTYGIVDSSQQRQENFATSSAWKDIIRSRCDGSIAEVLIYNGVHFNLSEHPPKVAGWKKFVKKIGYEDEE